MIEAERYVDFNGKPLKLLGYVFCELQVNESFVMKAKICLARNGTKSILGKEWQSTLRYKLVPEGELKVTEGPITWRCELKQIIRIHSFHVLVTSGNR